MIASMFKAIFNDLQTKFGLYSLGNFLIAPYIYKIRGKERKDLEAYTPFEILNTISNHFI